MQLKSLELSGFKSFPEKTVINFSEGITAIVGPNGSGKSNISDAIRWVMGETSAKSLRGVRMEDVIFDGTQDRKPLGFADVCLVLDNQDHSLPVEFDEVSVARRYYRSGESEYFINKQNVRLKDVQDLFRDTGLGKTGYSIIGQGSVTEIISSKSTDRRGIFEEAAGISKYKFKKEESEKKLAQTQDNILRLNDIITELSDRLGPLETQAKKARRYLELYGEKKTLEIAVWLRDMEKTKNDLKKTAEDLENNKTSIDQINITIDRLEEDISDLTERINGITSRIESLRAESKDIDDDLKNRESSILIKRNDIDHYLSDIQRIRNEIAEGDTDAKELDRQEQLQQDQILDINRHIESLDKETEEILKNRTEQDEADSNYMKHAAELQSAIISLNEKQTEFRIEHGKSAQTRIDEESKLDALREERRDADERLASLTSQIEYLAKCKEENDEQTEQNTNLRSGYLLRFNNRREKKEKLTELYNKTKDTLNEKVTKKNMLEDMEKHFDGFSGSVKSIMTESSRGILKGICGTVASLISVDKKYSVAIEIALGAAIQNIVTKTEQNAKDCIYYLKSRNLGRATFLPISSIKGKKLTGIKQTGGFIGIASDLISFDAEYDDVICQLLGRTVICGTIDDATNIAKANGYSFKVVSLDGQVVNAGGSITGGSTGKNTGILSRANEIESLTAETKELGDKLTEQMADLKTATQEEAAAGAQIQAVEAELKNLNDEAIKINSDLTHAKSSLATIQNDVDSFEETEKQILDVIDQTDAKTGMLSKKITETEKEIGTLSAELDEITSQHDNIAELRKEIDEQIHRKEIEKVEAENKIETINTVIASIREKREIGLLSKEKRESDISHINTLISDAEAAIREEENALEEIRTEVRNKEIEIEESNKSRNDLEIKKTKSNEDVKNLLTQREGLGRESERLSAKYESLKSESESFATKIWDEYEMTVSEAEAQVEYPEDMDAAKKRVSELKSSIKNLGAVNVGAIDEYTQVKERFDTLDAQVNDLTKAKEALLRIISDIEKDMTTLFADSFRRINDSFSTVFRELFNGGTAKLTLTDPENILESGIEIFVAPPGKIIKHLSSLSGGEQSLTAIALYFSLLKVRPSPFCLLDEIESALDDVNVTRYAQYLRNLSQRTQFLLITHRRGTMEAADRLYGVTMREKGISKILTIDVSEAELDD